MEGNTVQMIVSASIFVVAYALIIWDKFDKSVVALAGAALMIFTRILSQDEAIPHIDWNTLGLLVGMMTIVMTIKRSGLFEYIAIRIVKTAKGHPIIVLALLSVITGILSAFLDNVTTILLMLPIILSVAKDLHLNPIPFIITSVFASNVGGTATLIGDPPNIIIASASGLDFVDFLRVDGVIILPILLLITWIFVMMYRKKLKVSSRAAEAIALLDEKTAIKDKPLLIKSLIILGVVVTGFILEGVIHYHLATIALAGAAVLLIISGIKPDKVLKEVEWDSILFFIGLFVMVGALNESGVIGLLAKGILGMTGGNVVAATLSILWISAIAASFFGNIPFVVTMVPLIAEMGKMSAMDITPLWWALSLGACLGGNGTMIGAGANVIASAIAEDHGHKITFGKYFKTAFPVMLVTVAVSTVYLYLMFLV